jgi:1-pyrroline-5-carboxylate dehydrogenase
MNLPKNLAPRFNLKSKITSNVLYIINEIHKTPVFVNNVMCMDNPNPKILKQISAFDNRKTIAKYQNVDKLSLDRYFENYIDKKIQWEETSFTDRKNVLLRAADLLEHKYYDKMLAYTIAGQNKTIYEAEIDAICELCDFLRFNVAYAENIVKKQPLSDNECTNVSEYNSLNGFVSSITPFNFTAIGGNLASAPLLFGNSVLWKPSDNAILSNYLFYEILHEAGLPRGVLNFCPLEPDIFFNSVNERPDLGAVLFTGSSDVFDNIYQKIGENIRTKNNYTRLVGETGGKNFHFVDDTYDNEESLNYLAEQTVQSAFGYSGQKCSACSILYMPEENLERFIPILKRQLTKFMSTQRNYGLINSRAYTRVSEIIDSLKKDKEMDIIVNPVCDKDVSYLVTPLVFSCTNHDSYVFSKEFFAPILAIYPYKNEEFKNTISLATDSNNYALTGAFFSKDSTNVRKVSRLMKHKAGNFYINCKSTGSVVGNQPFGGSGKSGTNDKAGDVNLLFRLFNQRNIKIKH